MRISLTALTDQGPRDVVVNGDSDMTVKTVARSLIAALATEAVKEPLANVVRLPSARWVEEPIHTLWVGGRMLDPSANAARWLRDGVIVAIDPADAAATVLTEPAGIAEIRVIGGPASGAVHRLGLGEAVLGTAADVDVRPADPTMPPHALRITVRSRQVTVSGHGNMDGVPLAGVTEWRPGGVLTVGSSVLTLAPPTAPDVRPSPLEDGGLAYERPPRRPSAAPYVRIPVPRTPERGRDGRHRLVGALLFATTGVVLVVVTRQWYWALTALAYPVVQVGEWAGGRLQGRPSYPKAVKDHGRRQTEFDRALESAVRTEEAERRALAPDPAEVLLTATGPRRRLWERRRTDPDRLQLRFGLADRPAHVDLVPDRGMGAEPVMPETPIVRSVPVTLPLPALGVLGLAGPRDRSRALARWLVAQAATLHSPRDLAIVVLSADSDGGEHWNWMRWLPHCAPREGEECVALVGTDPESIARRVTELAIRITERRRAGDPAPGEPGPYDILLVMDGARRLSRVPGIRQVLSGGPGVGLYALCVEDDERLLPEECAAVAVWDWDRPTHVRLRGDGLDVTGPVLADQVSATWCDRLARALAPVRDVSRDDAEAALPREVRLLGLLGMPAPSAAQVRARWAAGGRTTSAPIGVGANGVFQVDLRADGPHGLIAGTTGAGGSELLRTLIASLATANRPEEMSFVLIGHKGGAAFADCVLLPHVTGVVTDLDDHLAERTLESLAEELGHREQFLGAAGATDIDDHHALSDAGDPRASARLPRLVLALDEFATVAADLPGFVDGLVDIGRRGRSLGVHLLLATRHPGDAAAAGVRAGTNLRIALRVTDPSESRDLIGDPSAARISRSVPGRCYVRSGAGMPGAVQTAWIGGRRPGTDAVSPPRVVPLPWPALGRPLPPVTADDEPAAVTDLTLLVSAIREAAEPIGRRPEIR